jgi:hypothetical protein
MQSNSTRRHFVKTLLAGTAGLNLLPSLARGAETKAFSLLLLGDLHYDRLACHALDTLQLDKPDDVRQVRQYSHLASDVLPLLFASVRDRIAELNRSPDTRVAFTAQVGDMVEGLCGSADQSRQLDANALDFVRGAKLGVPFLFAKGNHDITGPGATDAFKSEFHPFLSQQVEPFNGSSKLTAARYALEYGNALFCFFDAYDRESLAWLEATLAKRTAEHCFVIIHPPVVPYGARATWHLYSSEREKASRERLLDLLGRNNALVLTGHIHKYNLLVRATPKGGRFLQLGLSSVIYEPGAPAQHLLSGIKDYTSDQVAVEPNFSPATEKQRRAVYAVEAPFVKQFQYADLPGYAVLAVKGAQVSATIYSGVTREVWRTLNLTELLQA